LPSWFAAVHPVHRTPVNAVHFQGALAIVLAVGLGLLFRDVSTGGPLTTYVFIGYALGLLFAGMYIAVNLAAIGFYLGEQREEFNPIKHLVIPILGVVLMIPAFLSVLGGLTIPILNVEVPALTEPYSFVPPLVAVWMIVGVALYFWLRARRPDAIAKIGEVFGEA
jgi:amino acid transporter